MSAERIFFCERFFGPHKIVVNVEIIQIFVLSLRTASICIKPHKTPKLNIWSYLWTATYETFYVYWRSPVFLSIYIQIELFYICGCCSYFIVNSLGRRSFLSFSTFCWKYWLDKHTKIRSTCNIFPMWCEFTQNIHISINVK